MASIFNGNSNVCSNICNTRWPTRRAINAESGPRSWRQYIYRANMGLHGSCRLHVGLVMVIKIAVIGCNRHDDVIKQKQFPCYWPFVREIHCSPVDSLTKDQYNAGFDFVFDVSLNKRLNKQSSRRWFKTPWCSLCRQCNGKQSSHTRHTAPSFRSDLLSTPRRSRLSRDIL